MKTKTCSRCGKEKPVGKYALSELRKDGSARVGDGRIGVCNRCRWEQRKAAMSAWDEDRLSSASKKQQGYARKWDSRNPDSVSARSKANACNRHAMRAGAQGIVRTSDIRAAWSKYGKVCWVCGVAADQIDHFIPINKKSGGTNTPDNLRPICQECNQKRSHRWYGEAVAMKEARLLKQVKELLTACEP